MKRVLKWIGIALVLLIAVGVASFFYVRSAVAARFEKKYDIHVKKLPIPFPLSPREIAALRAAGTEAKGSAASSEGDASSLGSDDAPTPVADEGQTTVPTPTDSPEPKPDSADETASDSRPEPLAKATTTDRLEGVNLHAVARERAIARGKRYVETRAGCGDCHGDDFGGKVIIDSPVMGTWVAPNITRAGVTREYEPEDWVRIVRHGVGKDKTASTMPSADFEQLSDQEISDIAAYIESLPPLDRKMPDVSLGPIFTLLIYKGDIAISAEKIDHAKKRPVYPPPLRVSLDLGAHLANTCKGCHGAALAGGPIQGGDPSWPPARNLTFHESGLKTWSLDDFRKALREGVRPDGSKIDPVMPIAYTSRLKDTEIDAIYLYLKSLPAKQMGERQ